MTHRRESDGAGTRFDPDRDVRAVAVYSGEVRDLIHELKFGGDRRRALEAARLVADRWCPVADRTGAPPVVTWAPTTPDRRAARGFDQAELVARHLGVLLGLRVRRLLRRTSTGHQTGASRTERLGGPSFVARPVRGTHVVLVDDVVTTGATFAAAVGALREAGARGVECVAVARTPSPDIRQEG